VFFGFYPANMLYPAKNTFCVISGVVSH